MIRKPADSAAAAAVVVPVVVPVVGLPAVVVPGEGAVCHVAEARPGLLQAAEHQV